MFSSQKMATTNPNIAAQRLAKFELGVAVALHSWHALTVAVENEWGGPESDDKRNSLAGEIVEIFSSHPNLDEEDMESVILQAMDDLFNVDLEDGSEVQIAALILKIRRETSQGDFSTVDHMWETYSSKTAKPKPIRIASHSDSEDSIDDEDNEEEDDDVNMEDAPTPITREKTRIEPEIDEDGFTKVVRRKK